MHRLFRSPLSARLWVFALALLIGFSAAPLRAQKAKGPKPGSAPKASAFKLETITNSVGMTFVKIPAGSFIMGTETGQKLGKCPDCKGVGKREVARQRQERSQERCTACYGKGYTICTRSGCRNGYWQAYRGETIKCVSCDNDGHVRCNACGGSGNSSGTRTVTDGYDIRLCSACNGKGKRMVEVGGDTPADEKPAHKVIISKAFYLARTEVTQGQWKAVMGTTPWAGKAYVQEGDDYPAVNVSWEGAQEFCQHLSVMEGQTYRLPTEAEWEYADRAGRNTKYSSGDDESQLGDHAWFLENADRVGEKYAHRVATKKPNPWGLYDMEGNVWEWCQDWMGPFQRNEAIDPSGPSSGSDRVQRGGCWYNEASYCRSACRNNWATVDPNALGFRPLRVLR